MHKKTLVIDFDGVIHSYTSGYKGHATAEDPPVPGAIAFLYDALKTFKVAIFSSRSSTGAGIAAMRAYIELHCKAANFDHGQPWWLQIEWPVNKPAAYVTLDDRAITFTGEWPSIQSLVNFTPWNMKPKQNRSPEENLGGTGKSLAELEAELEVVQDIKVMQSVLPRLPLPQSEKGE